jgi:putative alpha-1,2-mannosidase
MYTTSTGGSRETAYYVQSLKVNGKPWDKAWLTWDDAFASGGTIDFVLDSEPMRWANGTLPPSPASPDEAIVIAVCTSKACIDTYIQRVVHGLA